jgi:hypothetical protein
MLQIKKQNKLSLHQILFIYKRVYFLQYFIHYFLFNNLNLIINLPLLFITIINSIIKLSFINLSLHLLNSINYSK